MARINLETKLWGEFEFQELLIKVGDRHKAKGMVTELFTLAQEYWFPDMNLIPKSKIESFGLQLCIDAGLAEERESGVYVIGSKDAFAWLFQKQDAGKQSGEARRNKKPKKTRERPLTPVERPSTSGNGSEPLYSSLLSPVPIPILDPSSFSKGRDHSVGEPQASPEIKSPVGLFIANYINAYQIKYGTKARPALIGKVQGQIKRFLSETPIDRAILLIQTYCEMNDAWFVTKCHDFGTFIENLSKVGLALDTGRKITQTKAREGDRAEANREVVRDYLQETGGL